MKKLIKAAIGTLALSALVACGGADLSGDYSDGTTESYAKGGGGGKGGKPAPEPTCTSQFVSCDAETPAGCANITGCLWMNTGASLEYGYVLECCY